MEPSHKILLSLEGYSSNVNLPNVGMSAVETSSSLGSGKECSDYMGRVIAHGMHYVPVGADMCKMCICADGVQNVKKIKEIKPQNFTFIFLELS